MANLAKEREDFIRLSLKGYYRYMDRALARREDSIIQAWQETGKPARQALFSGAWRNFGQSWREADNQMRDLISKAWKRYRENIVNCSPNAEDEERGGIGLDSQF